MENGMMVFDGAIDKALDRYNSQSELKKSKISWPKSEAPGNDKAIIKSVNVFSESGFNYIEEDVFVEVIFENLIAQQVLNVSISIFDDKENYLIASPNLKREKLKEGVFRSVCKLKKDTFNTGTYYFSVLLIGDNFELIVELEKIVSIEFQEEGTKRANFFDIWSGSLRPYFDWSNAEV